MMNTKQIKIGDVLIGGGAPVAIQSMTNTRTSDVSATVSQIKELTAAGCEIIRCAVPDMESANAISEIKKSISIPLVADIHFDYRLALSAIKNGADKIRINPGNIGSREDIGKVVAEAQKSGIPIRIGVNGGSLEKDILDKYGGITAEALVESAMRNIDIVRSFDFDDIVVSIKTSNIKVNYEAHKLLSAKTDLPLHIGITEAGIGQKAVIKSAVGIGALLMEGIGDTIRVSLTGNPVNEIIAAKDILSAAGLREGRIDVISCPTCGRTEVDLERIAGEVSLNLAALEEDRSNTGKGSMTVAVMGCRVNGPGEAKSADFGVACGNGRGVIFKKGEIIKTVDEGDIAKELDLIIRQSESY